MNAGFKILRTCNYHVLAVWPIIVGTGCLLVAASCERKIVESPKDIALAIDSLDPLNCSVAIRYEIACVNKAHDGYHKLRVLETGKSRGGVGYKIKIDRWCCRETEIGLGFASDTGEWSQVQGRYNRLLKYQVKKQEIQTLEGR